MQITILWCLQRANDFGKSENMIKILHLLLLRGEHQGFAFNLFTAASKDHASPAATTYEKEDVDIVFVKFRC